MLKRTILITSPKYLSLKNNQLRLCDEDNNICNEPIEDIGFLLLDNPQITLTLPLINALRENNTAVIFCDQTHHPRSMLLNLDGNTLQNELFHAQITAGAVLKKNIWKQVVTAKLRNQAAVLEHTGSSGNDIKKMAATVKSGDSDNREGYAARLYWPRLFGYDFKRLREGLPPNNMLNYGYTVIRAAVARALAGSGLLNTLGVHHRNRYNAFCLADDIMEPYRPFVDAAVFELNGIYPEQDLLHVDIKSALLDVLNSDCKINGNKRPLMIAMQSSAASLARCFSGQERNVVFPEFAG